MRECYRVLVREVRFSLTYGMRSSAIRLRRSLIKRSARFLSMIHPIFYELPFGFNDADLIRGLLQAPVSKQLRRRSSRY